MADLLVLWDLDYTLVNARGLGSRLYEVVFREMFGRELPAVAPKAGRTDRAIIADTLALAGIPADRELAGRFIAALARLASSLDGEVPAEVTALTGAAAAVTGLALPGVRQSVLTGNIRAVAALKLRLAGLGEHLDLDVGAYGDAHEVRAELVAVARAAARQAYGASFDGPATVLVGDTPLDVEAALATGARVVGVATGSYTAAELAAAGAPVVLPDLAETARVRAAVTGGLGTGSLLPRQRQPVTAGRGSPASTAGAARASRGGGAPGLPRRRSRTAGG